MCHLTHPRLVETFKSAFFTQVILATQCVKSDLFSKLNVY